jgi:hypothetical protein
MFSKLSKLSILVLILIGTLILFSCDSVAIPLPEGTVVLDPDNVETDPDETVPEIGESSETVMVEPDQPDTDPDETVPEIVQPFEGEFGVPSTRISEGAISVLLSTDQYKKGEIIATTITNGLDQTIYTLDMKTGCTIVILEKWNGSVWEALNVCGMARFPIVFAIGPSLERSVLLDPFSSAYGITEQQGPYLDEGTYRILFTYRLEPGGEGDEPFSAYSKDFNIVP